MIALNLNKWWWVALLPTFQSLAAEVSTADSAATGASGSNIDYYHKILGLGINFALSLSEVIALVALLILCGWAVRTKLNPNLVNNLGHKPITIGMFFGGLMTISALALPLHTMGIFLDLGGLADSNGSMCMTVDITRYGSQWASGAASCLDYAESRFADVAAYTNRDHIANANIGLFFTAIQFLSLVFFVGSAFILFMSFSGYRDVALKPWQAVVSMCFSSFAMATPEIAKYIEDIRGAGSVVINT